MRRKHRMAIRRAAAAATVMWPLLSGSVGAQQAADTLPAGKRDSTAAKPAPLSELVVTATRTTQQVREVPANVTVLAPEAVASTSAQTVAAMLWRIPGFTTRDYGNPMVSSGSRGMPAFRGFGGSSGGRTLLLLDGIPVNNPYNSWVQWGRVPLGLIDRVEVVRGGGSMIWGSRALGGVINIRTQDPRHNQVRLLAEGGGMSTFRGSAQATLRHEKLGVQVGADYLSTGGYIQVPPDQAGPIDVPRAMDNKVVSGKVTYDFSPAFRAYVSGNYLDERAHGGTPGDYGFDSMGEVRTGGRLVTSAGGILEISAYGNENSYANPSVAVSDDRTSESPRKYSHIPANGAGVAVQWSQAAFKTHQVTTGIDYTWIHGQYIEDYNYVNDQMTRQRKVNGHQVLGGIFVQDAVPIADRWRILGGLRYDRVGNTDGWRSEQSLVTGAVLSDTAYAPRTETGLTYSLGVRHDAATWFSWRASAYRAFRAPVQAELYQPFFSGKGSILEANPTLTTELLNGVEAGADIELGSTWLVRGTVFLNQVSDPIVDYTIGTATRTGEVIDPCGVMVKGQVCRQRRNVGALRSTGLEAELEWHPHRHWSAWASYAYNPTRVSAEGQVIDGKRARGAAINAATLLLSYENPRILSVSVEERYVDSRFDDDVNTIPLESFFLTGVRINRNLWKQANAYLKLDNLFNTQYIVTRGANGIGTVGSPRWVMVGIQVAR